LKVIPKYKGLSKTEKINVDFTFEEWVVGNSIFLNNYLNSNEFKKLNPLPSKSFQEQFYFWLFKVKNQRLEFYSEPWYTESIILESDRYFTSWGQKNIEKVLLLFSDWWNNNFTNRYEYFTQFYRTNDNLPFELNYYREKYFNSQFEYIQASYGLIYPFDWFMNHVVKYRTKTILRECENKCRLQLGIPMIGEGWVNETALYYFIKTLFSEFEVIHHGRPNFLGLQHYDIFIPELSIAIEYQGQQHKQPVEFFGGEIGYINNLERDKRKKKLSKQNGVKLIEVFPNYDEKKLVSQLRRIVKSRKQ
jgi:hypothetical protein